MHLGYKPLASSGDGLVLVAVSIPVQLEVFLMGFSIKFVHRCSRMFSADLPTFMLSHDAVCYYMMLAPQKST